MGAYKFGLKFDDPSRNGAVSLCPRRCPPTVWPIDLVVVGWLDGQRALENEGARAERPDVPRPSCVAVKRD